MTDFDVHLQNLAHSIQPLAPEHNWYQVAEIHYNKGGVQTLWRCHGCPLEKYIIQQ